MGFLGASGSKSPVGKQAGAEVRLDLEGILPVHSLDPALYLNDVAT